MQIKNDFGIINRNNCCTLTCSNPQKKKKKKKKKKKTKLKWYCNIGPCVYRQDFKNNPYIRKYPW